MKCSFAAVDVFSGIGGLTYGLKRAGIPVAAGIDNDESCRYAYETNNQAEFISEDIRNLNPKFIASLLKGAKIKILVGCAPCQPFSTHTQKNKSRERDERWELLRYFEKIVEEVEPEIVSMENVPSLQSKRIFIDFVMRLEDLGYQVWYKSIFCPAYGIPQRRRRLVLLASRLGRIELVPETHSPNEYPTVQDAIGKMEAIKAGETSRRDSLHRARNLSEKNLKRIKQSKPGGTWSDWDPELRASCHIKSSGSTYIGVYGRMEWNKPAPTITTQFFGYGTGRFGHPEQDRALSLREGALLQTFPRKYKFVRPKTIITYEMIGRHIGNAVPVRLGEIIGMSIKKHLREMTG